MKKRYFIIVAVAITALVLVFAFNSKNEKALKLDGIMVNNVDLVKFIQTSGTLEARDYEEINVPSGQKVAKVYASENNQISKGQPLAALDTGDLEFQLKKIEIARQQLADELAELLKPTTISGSESVKNRLGKVEAAYANVNRKLKDAEDKLETDKALYAEGAISLEEYKSKISIRDEIANQLIQEEANLENARNEYKDYDRNKALQIKAKQSQIASNNVDKESYLKRVEDSLLKASIDGIVAEFSLKEGRIPESGTIIRIYDMTQFNFVGVVPQEDAVQIKVGQEAVVQLKGIKNGYKAVVSEVKRYASLDKSSGSKTPKVMVSISLLSSDSSLAAGFDADATIQVGRQNQALAVKRESIYTDEAGNTFVFILENGIAKKEGVTLGLSDDYFVEIKSGIKEGMLIAANPPEGLKDGMKVKVNAK